jgi:hypothetical protein
MYDNDLALEAKIIYFVQTKYPTWVTLISTKKVTKKFGLEVYK